MIGINKLYIRSHVTDSIRHGGNKRVAFSPFTTMPFLFSKKGEICMFSFFKKKRDLSIYAPVDGEVIPLSFVPDPVFRDKLMGDGIAIIPTDGYFCAPINGKVILIAPTKHAIGLKAE
ncbi:PTS glucose transporter subunit IIA [Caldibacillus thermoamylovorans]|uniref:PTS sugar transporter subunit IIA n=1 Tax=Caldibacillus thermoamylovorans TaxID=35841 RepID=UPI0028891572|nr:PTS glucose transporter subunit IIA [Caldibacillus thermoamylovorans]